MGGELTPDDPLSSIFTIRLSSVSCNRASGTTHTGQADSYSNEECGDDEDGPFTAIHGIDPDCHKD